MTHGHMETCIYCVYMRVRIVNCTYVVYERLQNSRASERHGAYVMRWHLQSSQNARGLGCRDTVTAVRNPRAGESDQTKVNHRGHDRNTTVFFTLGYPLFPTLPTGREKWLARRSSWQSSQPRPTTHGAGAGQLRLVCAAHRALACSAKNAQPLSLNRYGVCRT